MVFHFFVDGSHLFLIANTLLVSAAAGSAAACLRARSRASHLAATNRALADARDRAERLAARAERLQSVATALATTETSAQVAGIVLGMGLGVVEASRGFLATLNGARLEMVDAQGYDSELRTRVHGVTIDTDVPLTRAVRSRKPVYLESVAEYRREYPWAYEQFGAVSATQAHAAIPLIYQDEVIGALGISFAAPTAFGATDKSFTLLLGEIAAAALHRARGFEEAQAERRHAEAMSRAREEVLAVVAHDLRNPLNLISSTSQLLLEIDPGREKRDHLLRICIRASQRMNHLIGDLLDVTRFQAGRFSLELERISVRSIVQQIDELFRQQAATRGIAFDAKAPDDDVVVVADSARALQALGNLVGNALKFTPDGGGVEVTADVAANGVVFRVADSGPGIPPEHISHLFDRFWQARNDRRGIGLGLAIAKGIADAHGGTIGVTSVVGRGTTFTLSLPCTPREPAAQSSLAA
jgi:signal transduction histidine kinase